MLLVAALGQVPAAERVLAGQVLPECPERGSFPFQFVVSLADQLSDAYYKT